MENESHIKINSARFDDLEEALKSTSDLTKLKQGEELDMKSFIDKILANQASIVNGMVKKDAFLNTQNDLVELQGQFREVSDFKKKYVDETDARTEADEKKAALVAELDELVKDLKLDLDRMHTDVVEKVGAESWIEECEDLRNLFLKTLQEADPELSKRQRSKAFLDITKRNLANKDTSLSKGDRQKF
jgi:vacuolar-type H+-ATPase subunit I/STV1